MASKKVIHSNRYNNICFFEDLDDQVIMSEYQ